MPSITKIEKALIDAPDTNNLDGWVVVDGSPTMKTWAVHTNAEGTMISGIWEATPGTYHATYTAYEFVNLISGKITITPDGGQAITVKGGDTFVVESHFKGTWKIEEPVCKYFDFQI